LATLEEFAAAALPSPGGGNREAQQVGTMAYERYDGDADDSALRLGDETDIPGPQSIQEPATVPRIRTHLTLDTQHFGQIADVHDAHRGRHHQTIFERRRKRQA
jgi:hypothetical protein